MQTHLFRIFLHMTCLILKVSINMGIQTGSRNFSSDRKLLKTLIIQTQTILYCLLMEHRQRERQKMLLVPQNDWNLILQQELYNEKNAATQESIEKMGVQRSGRWIIICIYSDNSGGIGSSIEVKSLRRLIYQSRIQ